MKIQFQQCLLQQMFGKLCGLTNAAHFFKFEMLLHCAGYRQLELGDYARPANLVVSPNIRHSFV